MNICTQTKPIRATTGADITQATLQQTLGELGINRYVADLGYAEKRLLIVISLTRQLAEATNDYGRTIESPANQMRILNEQWKRLSRAIGDLFLPILTKVLPYLNAILMVLTEIISTIATLFGYNDEDYDYFNAPAESAWDLGEALDSAAESAEKLKRGLRGFDKLNNITTPTPSSRTGGLSGGGGIDPSIMQGFSDAYDEYFRKIDKVQMKATKIRDTIMEWLGFTKEINEETGDISFKFDHITGGTIIAGVTGLGLMLGTLVKIRGILKKIFGSSSNATIMGLKPIKFFGVLTFAVTEVTNLAHQAKKFMDILANGGNLADALKIDSFSDGVSKLFANEFLSRSGIGRLAGFATSIAASLEKAGIIKIDVKDEVAAQAKINKIKDSLEGLSKSISKVTISDALVIDDSVVNDVKKSMNNLFKDITSTIKTNKNSMYSSLNSIVEKGLLSKDEMAKAKSKIDKYYGSIFEATSNNMTRINEILQTASNEKRELTQEEKDAISSLYDEMGNYTTSALSTSQREQAVIMQKIKDMNTDISRETASSLIKDAIKVKDEAIKNAEEQYDTTLLEAQKMYEIGAINKDQYDEICKNAKTTRDDTIKKAEEQYDGVWNEFEKGNKDIANYIDKDTGGVKSSWAVFWDGLGTKVSSTWKIVEEKVSEGMTKIKTKLNEKWSEFKTLFADKVGKYFTKDYWSGKLQNIKDAINNFRFPKIKLSVTYDTNVGLAKTAIYKALGLEGFPKLSITTYAQGGLPPVGQLFVANERGAELVGNLGGQSFVANQNQMMDLLDRKIGNAQQKQGTQVFNIYLDENHKIGTYTLQQLQQMAKTNGEPITLG